MWALIQDDIVLETTSINPEGRFHPDLKWRPCPAEVQIGWLFQSGIFSEKLETLAERSISERDWRDGELEALQWLRDRHRDEQDLGRPTTLSNEQYTEFLAYLQTLRDWPQAEDFPDSQQRPKPPHWIHIYTQ